jgi:hypothetical protein
LNEEVPVPTIHRIRLIFATALLLTLPPLATAADDFDNPLAAIAANPQLSQIYSLLKKSGYAEPLSTGGDITFLALSDKMLSITKSGERFSLLELFRNKIPPEALLLIMQSLTLDGQYTHTQFDELIAGQGNGKATVASVLGNDAKFHVHRGKGAGSYILEDARHNGLLITVANETLTQNGVVIVIDAGAAIPTK